MDYKNKFKELIFFYWICFYRVMTWEMKGGFELNSIVWN